jgi:hypothetical protein
MRCCGGQDNPAVKLTALGESTSKHILERGTGDLLPQRREGAEDAGGEAGLDGDDRATDKGNVGEDLCAESALGSSRYGIMKGLAVR